ncbi:MAG: RNA polymerase sigma factor [Sporocytophaga sp.]|uniref:RNA polymerase sigma factor n=1 Tax=Sporocytophaga sp. TaxID=2231183 RepID=UPI001B1A29E9|nr:RNA polymerase sigma factor [Sporocytophaga sp.]MBO9703410.1 RNA polymerase sigma factor [Sporocytophaga sp.]
MSEVELIKKIQNKDKAAIKELYLRYSPVMLSICVRYCGNREDAKDVMHECFIKIITQIGKYSGKGNFEGWMKRIMVNASLDFYKRKRKNEHIEIEEGHFSTSAADDDVFSGNSIDKRDVGGNPNDLILRADFSKEEIIESIYQIPESYRIIFNLFVIENYAHPEIAQMLGIEENTSRTRLFRAKEMIKKVLHQKSIERLAK